MINSYQSHPQKNSLFGLLALSIPFEDVDSAVTSAGGFDDVSSASSWTLSLLLILVNDLDIAEEQIHAYLPIIVISSDSSTQRSSFALRRDFAQPFLLKLALTYSDKILLLLQVLFRIAMIRMYDGRGRAFFRNLANLLDVCKEDVVSVEERVAIFFYTHIDKIETLIKAEVSDTEKNSQRNAKLLRYAKIGAVSIGAGALLAFTGGLAAPALAAAFLTMGSASAAAAVSVTTMATLFGGAGAGLAGYKMLRRTRGLQEFEFESYGDKNKFALMIVVSGWIEEDEDEKRAFGIVPSVMSDEERLTRFYETHCPERLGKIDKELDSFCFHMDDLYNQITELFGKDPRDHDQLFPSPTLEVSEEAAKVIEHFLIEVEQSTTGSSSSSSSTGGGKKTMTATASRFLQSTSASIFGSGRKKKEEENPAPTTGHTSSSSSAIMTSEQSRRKEESGTGVVDGQGFSLKEVREEKEEEARMRMMRREDYWTWSELEESRVYELCLLRWETRLQKEMGSSIHDLVKSLGSSAVENILAATVLTAVASAVLFPVFLIQMTSVIDNSWAMAVETADAAGKELALAILKRSTGSRPITLVGYSFGARVIYSCLRELAMVCGDLSDFDLAEDQFTTEDGSRSRSRGAVDDLEGGSGRGGAEEEKDKAAPKLTRLEIKAIIQDVVLLGAPVSSKSRAWPAIRSIVSGRLINGFSQKDLVLGLIYRYQRFHYSVSGVCEIEGVAGVENVDLSDVIESHTDYGKKMKQILQRIDLSHSL